MQRSRLSGLPRGTLGSEYRAFVEEFIVRNGRVTTRSEMGMLARQVIELYPGIPATDLVIRISAY